jgi:glycosyltransferase involved in cell wall biosynthesis
VKSTVKNPLRVLHVAPGKFGGGDSVVLSLVDMAREHGLHADVLCNSPELAEACAARHVRALNFKGIERPIRPHKDLWAAIRLYYAIRGRYEVVHTHSTKGGAVGRLAARWAKIPAVLHTAHGFAFHEFSSKMQTLMVARAERMMAHWCDKIIVVNEFDRQLALQLGIGTDEKLVTIYNGIPDSRLEPARQINRQELLDELQIGKDSFLCVFVGRLAPQKGLKCLMEAMAMVKGKMQSPKAHLAVIGEGELERSLRDQVQRLDLSDRVHFLGFQSACMRWTGQCDLFVLSSLWEGHSITLLEAMGVGRPIVATGIKGNRETITHNIDGLLVPPANAEALARAIMQLAANPAQTARLGQAAEETFNRRFTEKAMKNASWQVYEELLTAKGLL